MVVGKPPEPIWQAALHDPVALATVLLVIVTAGLWFSTFLLWRATVKLAKDAKESAETQAEKMERSVAEAAKAVQAMQRQNEIAIDTAYRRLRAYLSLHPVEIDDLALNSKPVVVELPIENTGSTPANEFRIHFAWRVTDEEPSSEFYDKYLGPYRDYQGEHSIGPGQLKKVPFYLDIGDDFRARVIAGTAQLYVLGDIQYRDVFGVERKTEFFYAYSPKLPNRLGQVRFRNIIA